jgi:hypothetical protein
MKEDEGREEDEGRKIKEENTHQWGKKTMKESNERFAGRKGRKEGRKERRKEGRKE